MVSVTKFLLFLRRSRFLITAPLRESLPEALALHNIPHVGMEARCVVKQWGLNHMELNHMELNYMELNHTGLTYS